MRCFFACHNLFLIRSFTSPLVYQFDENKNVAFYE